MATDSFDGLKHVCFDKDGTLTDVHAYWAHICGLRAARLARIHALDSRAAAGLLEAMGVAGKDRLKSEGPVGYHPRPIVIDAVLQKLGEEGIAASVDDIGRLFAEVDADLLSTDDYHLVMLPGASELLEDLVRRGLRLSLYTSDRAANAAAVLERLGLRRFFGAIVGGDSVKRSKPDPEGFLLACEKMGAAPNESAYVGDTLDDLKMAAAGGAARAIAVATGLDALATLSRATPHAHAGLIDLLSRQGAA